MLGVLKKVGLVLGSIVVLILLFLLVVNIIPPKKDMENNPFITTTGKPMIVAHRGGKESNPENTMKAYKACVNEFEVDVLETDLWLTKDEELILMHDETVLRTSDADLITGITEKSDLAVRKFTLDELRNFNFGYNFKKGENYPYRNLVSADDPNRKQILKDNDLSVVTFAEFLGEFYDDHKDLLFIVEIKNSGEEGFRACEIVNNVLNNYPDYKNRLVVGTFHDEIENHLKVNYPHILRGASTNVATQFVLTSMLGVNLFEKNKFACLQIPMKAKGINLVNKSVVRRAHRRNIAVQYWTINNEEDMRTLIKLGCDGIMTDNPELLHQVLEDMF